MKFFVATKNAHKLDELKRILEPMGIDAVCENDVEGELPEAEENGTTFEENALIKARAGRDFSGLSTVADDSGLCVDYLDGAPGIYSARFSDAGDEGNNKKLLDLLKDVPMEKRTARFVSVIACVFADGREFTVRGDCEGHIAFEVTGKGGFGYDPLFISEAGRFSEITPQQKDAVSHRGKSLQKLAERLEKEMPEIEQKQEFVSAMKGKERAELRAKANTLNCVMQIGKGGITEQVIAQADFELDSKELIKIQVLETSPIDARSAAVELANKLNAEIIQVIGRRFIIYRENPDKDNEKKAAKKKKKAVKPKKNNTRNYAKKSPYTRAKAPSRFFAKKKSSSVKKNG